MKKEKEAKLSKRQAFMSFLEAPTTPTSQIVEETKRNNSDHEDVYEQFVEDTNTCNVCGKDLDPSKKKKCGYCNLETCNDHLRKRRKKKNKWQRICDNCQDRIIFQIYTKLQSKAEQAIQVQEQITTLKHDNYLQQVTLRRQRRRQIAFKSMSIQQKHEQEMKTIIDSENRQMSLQHKIESDELHIKQLQIFIERAQTTFKQNTKRISRQCILLFYHRSQENAREAKQLAKAEKKCLEIRNLIDKKQKQIEDAYEAWERKQYKREAEAEERTPQQAKPKESCQIY